MNLNEQLKAAVAAALAGEWDQSHRIVQEFSDPTACRIHAVLHKIEGDEWNSRYWYARTRGANYEDFADPTAELEAIRQYLNEASPRQ
jgi:hypothetical protein